MWVKICGVTDPASLEHCIESGADAVGLNLVPSSKRHVDVEVARELVLLARGRVECILVVADLPLDEARALLERTGASRLQLHGAEPPDYVAALPQAFKALRVADADDVARAAQFPRDPLLVDAVAPGQLGGTGQRVDLELVTPLCRARRVILAGGLTPDGVAAAVRAVHPFGVDVASGVEVPGQARRKSAEAVRRFVANARSAEVDG
jgi:phosphoribosylanthranilate isomerase